MGRLRARSKAWLSLVAALTAVMAIAVAHAHPLASIPTTTNPYTGRSASPDCTWYAWQRMHDALGIDMQATADAGGWALLAHRTNEFWWEPGQRYVPAQVNPGLTSSPSPGDVVVFPDAVKRWANPSHVAFVEAVEPTRYYISEQSFQDYAPGPNTQPYPYVTHRWISLAAMRQAEPRASFIHFTAPVGDDGQYVTESPYPTTVHAGQSFTISFTERNTGFHTWSDADGYQLVCTADCMGAPSIGSAGASISPGQQFQFTIPLRSPTTLGTYHTSWQLVHDGIAFGNRGMYMEVNVVPPDESQWEAEPQVANALPGQVTFIAFTYTNTGTTTWSDADGYTLACDTSTSDSAGCLQGHDVGLEGVQVAPGLSYSFFVLVTAPSTPGTYRTYWDMHHHGLVFGDRSGCVDIVVGSPVTPIPNSTIPIMPTGTGSGGATGTATPASTSTATTTS
jgi:surface antigen